MIVAASTAVAIECEQCGHYHRFPPGAAGDGVTGDLNCPQCGHKHGSLPATWTALEDCPLCGCRHLYRRKDFNQLVGLALIAVGAILAVAVSYWFLLVFSLLDLLLYRQVRDVAVCHRCSAEFRDAAGSGELPLFDHHTADIYQPVDSVAGQR
ncbi:MAG: hypothetical protein IID15_00750 [Candidatus Marinimicrobia bacterium]|nr:hypothetical protein [Candidatus Neomarinimicrobiota bacterium]